MNIDYTSSCVHPNGVIFEATFRPRWGIDGNLNYVFVKIYTGVLITYPDGIRRWISNNWFNN